MDLPESQIKDKYDAFISYSHKDCGKIAPAIQRGIERISKPWWRIGRIRNVYRDVTDLTAHPDLWGSIVNALSQSKFLVLLASPRAAQSKWVNKELEWWLRHRKVELIIFCVVDGDLNWEETDFNWTTTTCIPEVLSGRCQVEPLFVDFRDFASGNEGDDRMLNTPIVKIISGITGKSPREIDSEELRSIRITRNVRLFSVLFLAFLLIVSFILFLDANSERKNAENRLREAQLLRLKEFVRNAQIFKEAGNTLGNSMSVEMIDSANTILLQYSTDSLFINASRRLQDF